MKNILIGTFFLLLISGCASNNFNEYWKRDHLVNIDDYSSSNNKIQKQKKIASKEYNFEENNEVETFKVFNPQDNCCEKVIIHEKED